MFEIQVEETFAAGHALRGYRGKCENPHGHNYRVQVRVVGTQLNAIGLLDDFKDLKHDLREISEGLDHQYLNDLPAFTTLNPSAENMAKFFYDGLQSRVSQRSAAVRVAAVTVYETDITSATYSE